MSAWVKVALGFGVSVLAVVGLVIQRIDASVDRRKREEIHKRITNRDQARGPTGRVQSDEGGSRSSGFRCGIPATRHQMASTYASIGVVPGTTSR
jgi:hypothetical protein